MSVILVQPDDGIRPVVTAIQKAKKSIDIGIFRLDRGEVANALRVAAERGVLVRTLIAHTNHGGERRLRKLEQKLLKTGAAVRRTDDDLRRYHNKIMIVDRSTLYVLGFNYTAQDIHKSRSFGIATKKRDLVQEALKLFESDSLREPYTNGPKRFIVSPENARERLSAFIKGARRELHIYDPKLTDPRMIKLLHERQAGGVTVRIMGKLGKRGAGLTYEKFPGKRLHVRALIADGKRAFVGSQSLRKLELDGRREVGIVVKDPKVVGRMAEVFASDWALTDTGKKELKKAKKLEAKALAKAKGKSKSKKAKSKDRSKSKR